MTIIDNLKQLIREIYEKHMDKDEEINLVPSGLTNGIINMSEDQSKKDNRIYLQMKTESGINIEAHFDNLGINTLIAELRSIQPDLQQKEAIFKEGCTIEGIYIMNGTNIATTETGEKNITFVITNPKLKLGMMFHLDKQQAQDVLQNLTDQLQKIK